MSNSTSATDGGEPPRDDAVPVRRAGIRPRTRWLLAATVLGGAVTGLGAFTFGFARGHSYLTDDPAACANCHIMEDYYAAWQRGSHRSAATCNGCHTPHDLVGKYATKAINGFWHSFYFTTGNHPDPIRIGTRNRVITERACRDCHQEITAAITPGAHVAPGPEAAHASDDAWRTRDGSVRAAWASTQEEDRSASCIRCHAAVGHWVR